MSTEIREASPSGWRIGRWVIAVMGWQHDWVDRAGELSPIERMAQDWQERNPEP